ncbi:MAG: Ig-like domain-containing protein [Gaiellaceae bacterium]
MSPRALVLGAVVASAAVFAAGGATRMSAASFTAELTAADNVLAANRLGNHFAVVPGPNSSGDVDSLAVDLGLVASPGTVGGVFTVTNVSGQSRTATLALLGPSQVASATFASSGTASATLAPAASTTVTLTTSPTVAGHGTGTLRLGLGGSSWLYRDYDLALDAAPAAPATLDAVAKPAGRVDLSWSASATTANLAGYQVYRSAGASWTKLTAAPVADTSYSDTATVDGTLYSYAVRAISTGAPALESGDSPHAGARADATAPALPSAVQLVNGGGQGNQYVNLANRASVSVSATLPGSSQTTDVLRVTLSNGAQSVSTTAAAPGGGGVVTVTGIDASALADGTLTISATVADAAGNVSPAKTASVPKDTVAPGAPSAAYVDRKNQADQITGTAEGSATVTASQTVPQSSGPYVATAASGGAYTLTVADTKGTPGKPVTVTYLVTARDVAGNLGATTTLTYAVTQ